ncbi:MAG: metallophosphoesterase, partial [Actinobacteria bacterium]|nr:metallophosphoesterase [Actinomycetota bacterium]
MAARVLHVSDLHVGAHDAAEVTDALRRLTQELGPELVVATGDLTNRGRRSEHERAHALLTS